MAAVVTYKKVYLFYQDPYQSNVEDLETFKVHLKIRKTHDGTLWYHLGLAASALPEKHNITSDIANEEQKIEAKIKLVENI